MSFVRCRRSRDNGGESTGRRGRIVFPVVSGLLLLLLIGSQLSEMARSARGAQVWLEWNWERARRMIRFACNCIDHLSRTRAKDIGAKHATDQHALLFYVHFPMPFTALARSMRVWKMSTSCVKCFTRRFGTQIRNTFHEMPHEECISERPEFKSSGPATRLTSAKLDQSVTLWLLPAMKGATANRE